MYCFAEDCRNVSAPNIALFTSGHNLSSSYGTQILETSADIANLRCGVFVQNVQFCDIQGFFHEAQHAKKMFENRLSIPLRLI